jgi:DNA-binding NtrC family response regulator
MLRTEAPGANAALSQSTETVLLAEDEETVRTMLRLLLQRAGFRVLEADNGTQALALCQSHPGSIDLLVADALIVPLGGRQLIEQVARRRPETRVLCISGYPRETLVAEGLLNPDVAFLQKPFTSTLLNQKVSEMLAR